MLGVSWLPPPPPYVDLSISDGSCLGMALSFSKGKGEDQGDGGTVGAPQWGSGSGD